ncbi:MAG: porin [Verrucomicrobiota bacterium]
MKFSSSILFGLIFCLATACLHGQTETAHPPSDFDGVVPLSELVRRGIITDEQSEYIRSGAVGIEPRVKVTKTMEQLTISGYMQFQYSYVDPNDEALPNPPATNAFFSQNLVLGIDASLGQGWHGVVNANFAEGFSNRNYLDSATITSSWKEWGKLAIGYQKAHFGLEEYTSSRIIPAVERSIATRYFTSGFNRIGGGLFGNSLGGLGTTRLGLGARRLGVFWAGKIPGADQLRYFVELTNGFQDFNPPVNTGSQNQLGYSGGVLYDYDGKLGPIFEGDWIDFTVGLNATYQPAGNSLSAGGLQQTNSITGLNPYAQFEFLDFHFIGELMTAWVERGRATGTSGPFSVTGFNTADANPIGVNFFAVYTFDKLIEPVFRFSMIDSDKAGINPNVVARGPAFGGPLPASYLSPIGVGFFDRAQSYYFGFNWYVLGNTAKVSAGYERIEFQGRWDNLGGFNGPDASEDAFRVRAQVVF